MTDTATPMFPLGSVLFPSMVLPLHVFEPRYRALVRRCLDDDAEFGVTLIERGSEVGGGDVRTGSGTLARIVEYRELDDGRWLVGAVGTRRIQVAEWLADDPYPRAAVTDWPDPAASPGDDAAVAEVTRQLRRLFALVVELELGPAPLDIELADDPVLASHQLSALSPVGPLDKQALLDAPSVGARLALLAELLDDREALLRADLG